MNTQIRVDYLKSLGIPMEEIKNKDNRKEVELDCDPIK